MGRNDPEFCLRFGFISSKTPESVVELVLLLPAVEQDGKEN